MASDFKLSNFLIGIVVVAAFVSVFMLIAINGANKYSVTMDNSTFSSFQNKSQQIYNMTVVVANQSSSFSSQNNLFDILGSLTTQAYSTIKTTFLSIDMFTSMASEGIGKMGLGPAQNVIQGLIISIIAIIIFVGIVLAMIVKWRT